MFALIHVSMICMCSNKKLSTSMLQGFIAKPSKTLQPKQWKTIYQAH